MQRLILCRQAGVRIYNTPQFTNTIKNMKEKRTSKEYEKLVTELYISAIQNYFYRNAIKNCPLPIIHAIGEIDKNKTVFTRYEFEYMLNCLHDFLNR